MSAGNVHVADFGIVITVTITDGAGNPVDVSTATVRQICLISPSGTATAYAASFVTDGTDGEIRYTTASGDIDEGGEWKIEAMVRDAATFRHTTNAGRFWVETQLCP